VSGRPSLARLSAFNFGFQFVWGAVLALSLQTRASELGGASGVRDYATIASIGAAIGAVVQVVAGRLADRRRARVGHRREFITYGTALAVPALLWFYLAPTFPQLVASFALLEIALNVATGPYAAVIPDFVPVARRGIASSFMSAFQSLGNAAGLVLVVVVTATRHGGGDLPIGAALGAGLALCAAVTLAHTRGLAGEPAASAGGPVRLGGPLGALLLSRGTINVGFYTLLGFLLFFVRDALGVHGAATQTQTGLIFLTFTLLAVGGAALAAGPSDRYDKRLVISLSVGVVALALGGLAVAQTLPVAYLAAGLAGAAWGAFVTADWALAAVVLPPGAMATAMGIWNVGTAVPQIVAPLLTTPLVLRLDAVHPGLGTRAAIVLSLVEFVIGGALIWRLPNA